VLDALYNEPLRVNAYVAHKLWLDLHTPYYTDREPEARAGADVRYVEVFEDGRYRGVYLQSEQVDRKQLKLKKTKDGEVRGELYKAVDRTETTQLTGQARRPFRTERTEIGLGALPPGIYVLRLADRSVRVVVR
jgi:hypothetical protein